MKRWLILVFGLLVATTGQASQQQLQSLVQVIDYIGVDYAGAVANGQVLSEDEYHEMSEFASAVVEGIGQLPPNPAKAQLEGLAATLRAAVRDKREPGVVGQQVVNLRRGIIENYPLKTTPRQAPDWTRAGELYAQNCAACHGATGAGDGPAAAGLAPAPTNFRDYARYRQRTVYGLYSTVTLGVGDTAMRSFSELTDDERWALAFYVGALGVPADQTAASPSLSETTREAYPRLAHLTEFTTTSPAEAEQAYGLEGLALMGALRRAPEPLFNDNATSLNLARDRLTSSLEAMQAGDRDRAYQLALEGYLEGFEPVEASLKAVAPELMSRIENGMITYRNGLRSGVDRPMLEEWVGALQVNLAEAEERLGLDTLSGAAAYTGALVVLLREGLEAILVIAALMAFLLRTGRRDAMPFLHAGWIAALVAGVATWAFSSYVVSISGAGREMTEAVAALAATVVLVYVGIWMHSKTSAARWQEFIHRSMDKALNGPTLWSLSLLAFITVYREAFETILFYQAMWAQGDAVGRSMMTGGFVTAVAALLVVVWLVTRYSSRLPLRQFFSITGGLMFLLAVVFAGKGVAALQEAGTVVASPLAIPEVEWLGVYPTTESIGLQLIVAALIGAVLLWNRRRTAAVGI